LRERPALDEVFGVTRAAGEGQPVKVDATLSGSFDSPVLKLRADQPAAGVMADASVKVAGGKALGQTAEAPVCILNRIGQGAAVLFNVSLHEYSSRPDDQGRRPFYSMMAALFAGADLTPHWRVLDRDGRPLAGGRVSAFARGKASLLGLLPPRPDDVARPVPATVVRDRPAHLYDLRQGKYLGKTDRASVALKFTSATFLSALPYRVSKLEVNVPARLAAGKPCAVRVRLAAEGDTAGAQPVFRVNVIGPDGADRHYYAKTLCPRGLEASTTIPFALNDARGEWKVVARDVLSGTKATATVRLEGGR